MKQIFRISFLSLLSFSSSAQCADTANIYSFVYNGSSYELIRENKTWVNAANCAVERGGFLAEINDLAEQNAIYTELSTNAGIVLNNTVAPDGGGASYVWLGGNDLSVEGTWIWDGNNDNAGSQFWQGNASGNPVGGLYSNWGNEPDNFSEQDALGLALTQWPLASGSLGTASQWNDVDQDNTLYFLVEYQSSLGLTHESSNNELHFYPNPVEDFINVENTTLEIVKIFLTNAEGKEITAMNCEGSISPTMNLSKLKPGIYYLNADFKNGTSKSVKIAH